MNNKQNLIQVIGAGGHAKVVIQTARAAGFFPVSVYDDNEHLAGGQLCGVPIKCPVPLAAEKDIPTIIAIGNNHIRWQFAEKFSLNWATVIHPTAVVDPTVQIGKGTVVLAGAIIQVDTVVEGHVIINTSSSIDHDCVIGDFVHIAPGTHLCGGVSIGTGTLIGVGACIKPLLKVGMWSIVGAGAAVTSHLTDNIVAVGVPAKMIHKNN
jgi:sugar O-acyltransferase (sialic acid O-acetyltransferase NeuD family)